MGLAHILSIVEDIREAVEPLGYSVACTAPRNRPWSPILRIYQDERDKGKPMRALFEADRFNRYTLGEALNALGVAGHDTTTPRG